MKTLLFVCATAALAGCAAPSSPERVSLFLSTVPTCREARECEVKWSAARAWVSTHVGMKLQTVQPDYLATYNPPTGAMELAAVVNKAAMPDGRYRIEVKLWCGNPIGCDMPPMEAGIAFNKAVNESMK